jgi:hypothetical protein
MRQTKPILRLRFADCAKRTQLPEAGHCGGVGERTGRARGPMAQTKPICCRQGPARQTKPISVRAELELKSLQKQIYAVCARFTGSEKQSQKAVAGGRYSVVGWKSAALNEPNLGRLEWSRGPEGRKMQNEANSAHQDRARGCGMKGKCAKRSQLPEIEPKRWRWNPPPYAGHTCPAGHDRNRLPGDGLAAILRARVPPEGSYPLWGTCRKARIHAPGACRRSQIS